MVIVLNRNFGLSFPVWGSDPFITEIKDISSVSTGCLSAEIASKLRAVYLEGDWIKQPTSTWAQIPYTEHTALNVIKVKTTVYPLYEDLWEYTNQIITEVSYFYEIHTIVEHTIIIFKAGASFSSRIHGNKTRIHPISIIHLYFCNFICNFNKELVE